MALILNYKQSEAIKKAKLGRNLFITGSGGVGKSVVIRELEREFGGTSILLAPTGIAALNIGGSTLHRTFGLPFSIATDDDSRHYSNKALELFRDDDYVKTIIIDEISMVRADMLVTIDKKLRHLKRKKDVPFGGVQVIVVGDFFQLPPVLTDNDAEAYYELYSSAFCFDTDTWDDCDFDIINLTDVMRQDDANTVRALNAIRRGKESPAILKWLNTTCSKNTVNHEAIVLCTTNSNAGELNAERYDEIDAEEYQYSAKTTGQFRDRPVDACLRLKEGCRVMVCANDAIAGYMNGQTGVVTGFNPDYILVELDTGSVVQVAKNTWEQFDYVISNGKLSKSVIGSYTQFPLKLGYAITVHKSQGMTLDDCHIDLGRGAFAHGQTYVALSRIRSLDRLTLERPVRQSDIIVDDEVIEFQNYIEEMEAS